MKQHGNSYYLNKNVTTHKSLFIMLKREEQHHVWILRTSRTDANAENNGCSQHAVKSYLELEDLWECVDPTSDVGIKKDTRAKS